ncbi:MAG: serine protease Do, partial [Pirellulaceae bacterium]
RPVRLGPVRLSPVRLSPVRLSPVRLSPVRLSPVRLRPVRLGLLDSTPGPRQASRLDETAVAETVLAETVLDETSLTALGKSSPGKHVDTLPLPNTDASQGDVILSRATTSFAASPKLLQTSPRGKSRLRMSIHPRRLSLCAPLKRAPRKCLPVMCVLLIAILSLNLPVRSIQAQEVSALQLAVAMEKQLIETIGKAEESVVAIARVRKQVAGAVQPRGLRWNESRDPTSPDFIPNEYGTGVVIDKDGLILTTAHVLGQIKQNDYHVWIQRKPYFAKVKASDPWMDLAVLQIQATNLKPVTFGDATTLKKGNIVITLGNPQAIARDGEPSAGWGIISNLSRQAPPRKTLEGAEARDSLHHYGTLIQTDAKLNFGTSGGALLNLKGEMVGLTTSLTALNGLESSAGFAIPVNESFQQALRSLKLGESPRYGFLGIEPRDLTIEERQTGMQGIRVGSVVRGTPAFAAGLRDRDIVLSVDNRNVNSAASLVRLVSEMPARAEVELLVHTFPFRQPPTKKKVLLGKKFVGSSRVAYSEKAPPGWRGIQVDFPTAIPPYQLDQRRSEIDTEGCVVVTSIDVDSASWKAGLRQYAFISHVGTQRVASPEQFFAAVGENEETVRLRITMPIDGKTSVVVDATDSTQ